MNAARPQRAPERENERVAISSEERGADLTPDCCWGDLWFFCLFHRRDVGHEVDVL